ncbi:MAG TPA: PIN domain-containing protein [Gammaproteobacteria bacterium]|jgi:predicted nucleic acid-binding protein|nr:PIN domain-containing protein [Gammaproteobacteria bacterium]
MDTSAWIEYLRGSRQGVRIKDLIRPPGKVVEVITPTIALAELRKHYVERGLLGFDEDLVTVRGISDSIPTLDQETALLAGKLRANAKGDSPSMADCILLAVAKRTGGKVISTDPHFKGRPEAIFLGGVKG